MSSNVIIENYTFLFKDIDYFPKIQRGSYSNISPFIR